MAGDEARAGKRRCGDIEQYLGADRAQAQDESPERRQHRQREFRRGQRLHVLGNRELQTQRYGSRQVPKASTEQPQIA